MEDNDLLDLTVTFALISILAVGGANAVAPEIQRVVVSNQGWMSASEFARLFGIAQAAPGPNLLLVSLVGWQVSGWTGLLIATIAVLVPSSLLALAVGRIYARWERQVWLRRAQQAVLPIVLGLILASGLVMAHSAATHGALVPITIGAAALTALTKINPLWAIVGGALAGEVLTGLGLL